ncbi:MAG: PDZ domain-containing protein, partial [Nannocystaceae bacterium]
GGLEVVLQPRVSATDASTAGVAGAMAVATVPGTATTDEDGNFVVKGLDAGDYDVSVSVGPGQRLEWAQPRPEDPTAPIVLTVAEGERREGVSLVVEARDQVITGVVLGPQGEPVGDAWVTAVRSGSVRTGVGQVSPAGRDGSASAPPLDEDRERHVQQLELLGLSEPPVLTDEGGRFTVQGLRSGRYRLRAEAHKDGARGFVDEVELGSEVSIQLESLAGLQGLVRASGRPVREYTIEVRGRSIRKQQVHAPDGRFILGRLDPGEVEVLARCSEGTAKAEVTIEPGQTTSVTLEIGGWGTLRGIVVDAGTGDPIAGLSVGVLGDTGPSAGSVEGMVTGIGPKTDDAGRFEIDQVPPGEGTIVFFDRDATGPDGMVAQAEYVIEPEEDYDLGTITGVAPSYVSPSERGTVGLVVLVSTYAARPRAPLAEDDEQEAAFDRTPRLWVSRVTPYGPAARQGLVPGDEVLSVDGSGVRSMGADNAAKLISARYLRVGDELILEIEHDGRRRRVTLTVEPTD